MASSLRAASKYSSPGKNIAVGLVFQHNQNCVKGLFQELQSKWIYRVAGGYIVSAWVILQVAAIVFPSPVTMQHREKIIAAAAEHRLPAMYPYRFFTVDGGLMSYGASLLDLYSGAALYVDRILKGAKVAELPVQQPTKYELVINLKTVKALGLTVPSTLLAHADAVIE